MKSTCNRGTWRLERLAGPAAIDALVPEWEALDAELSPRTPFTGPLWNRLWWQYLSVHGWLVRDEFFVHAVRDGDGRLAAVAPLMLSRRPGIGPLALRELQFFGADPNITEIRGLICRPQDQDAAIAALVAGLAAQPVRWDWLKWGRLPPDSPICRRLVDDGVLAWTGSLPDMVLDLPASWSSFHAGLPRNIRESLRKCYNSLRRDGHELELRVIERPEQVSAALDCFFALHAARAGLAQGIVHRNTFAEPAARHFLTDFLGQIAERGQLRLFQLEIGGAVRATRIGFQFGDELYLYYSGYDPDWGKYSIMTTTLAEAIRWAIAQGVRLVNLSTGIDVSKTRWRPREVRYAEAVQIAPTLRSRVAFQALEAARRGSSDASLLGQLLTLSRRHKIRRTIRPDR